jgi:hypothetical protein
MRKLIVLVEALALAVAIVVVAAVNPQTGHMMVAASQAANGPHETFMRKVIGFAQAAGTAAQCSGEGKGNTQSVPLPLDRRDD